MFGNTQLVLILSGENLRLKLKLKFLHNQAYKTSELISKLARIVAQEKLLLQEFNDVFHDICVLEVTKYCLGSSSYSTDILFFFMAFLFLMRQIRGKKGST